MKKIITLLFMLSILLVWPDNTHAQQVNFNISPMYNEIKIMPGKTVTLPYDVTNNGDPTTVQFTLYRLAPKDSKGNMKVVAITEKDPQIRIVFSEIALNTPFLLHSGDSKHIVLQINIPADAQPKEYYYAFGLQSNPQPNREGSTKIFIREVISSTLQISVTPIENPEVTAKISDFKINPTLELPFIGAIIDSNKPIPVLLNVENTSNFSTTPQATISLSEGKKVTSYTIHSQKVFPQSKRTLILNIQKDENSSVILPGKFMGSYSLSAHVTFPNAKNIEYKKINFIVFPIKFFSIGLVILLLVYITLLLTRYTKKI